MFFFVCLFVGNFFSVSCFFFVFFAVFFLISFKLEPFPLSFTIPRVHFGKLSGQSVAIVTRNNVGEKSAFPFCAKTCIKENQEV